MDEKTLRQNLEEELINGWDVLPTGTGFLIQTDWRWPHHERIEIHVKSVGEREDLYLVTDGGDLFNLLFSHGIDLTKDVHGMKVLEGVARSHGAKVVDFTVARGANSGDLPRVVRMMIETLKEASFLLWHKLSHGDSLH
jgi:hypothetical protein